MTIEVERRVLAILAESPRGRALFSDVDEICALRTLALFIDRPVSDVYEMLDGSVTGRITDAGKRRLGKLK